MSDRRWCPASTIKGEPCQVAPIAGREWCVWHDPERQGEAQRLRRKGGLARKAGKARAVPSDDLPDPPTTAEGCEDALRWVYKAIATDMVDPPRGRELVTALKVLHAAILKRENVDGRLRQLERDLKRA